jgi:formylglycine-generating enzyme
MCSKRSIVKSGLLTCALAAAISPKVPTAATAPPSVALRLDVVENTQEGPAFERCMWDREVNERDPVSSRIVYGEVMLQGGKEWVGRSRTACVERATPESLNPWGAQGAPYLRIDTSFRVQERSEQQVRLQVRLMFHKLVGWAQGGTPTYETKEEERILTMPIGQTTFSTLLIAGERERGLFGVNELLLRLHAFASVPAVATQAEYGDVAVTADVPRARIFLDGGFAEWVSEGPTLLRAVRAGMHEVSVVDPSGRQARTTFRVDPGGRAEVSLSLLPKSPLSGGLRPLGRNSQGGEEFWSEKDRSILVRIPGGEFKMGSASGESDANERPVHTVRLDGVLMHKTEVTWGQYFQFARETSRPLPKGPIWGMLEAYPVSNVTWEESEAFCTWFGGHLPTEAQWERAARAVDGRQYPWGEQWHPARCNTQLGGPHGPTAAAMHPDCVSAEGVLDLAGSMWEWCRDWYDADYYAKSPMENPLGPETGSTRVARGGGWINSSSMVRGAVRQGISSTWTDGTRGFRCVRDDIGGGK